MASGESDGGSPAFGPLLRSHRVAAGLTQEALAEAAGLSARAVRALEAGERTAPHRDTVRLLAGALPLSGDERAALEAGARRPARRWPTDTPTPTRAPGALPAAAHAARRARTRGGGDPRPARAGGRALADADRDGRRRQDPPGPPRGGRPGAHRRLAGRRAGRRAVPGRRPAGGAGGAARPGARAPGRRRGGGRSRGAGAAPGRHPRRRAPPQAPAAGAGQLRARPAGRRARWWRPCWRRARGWRCWPPAAGRSGSPASTSTRCSPLPLPAPPDPVRPPTPAALSRCEAVAALRRSGPRPCGRTSPSRARTPRRWPRSAAGWTGCRLAIELAAAQVKVLPPRALLARLAAPAGGPRRVAPGTRPPASKRCGPRIDWSHALLGRGRSGSCFRRLAVFAGGWTLDAAEAVCDCPDGSSPGRPAGARARCSTRACSGSRSRRDGEPRFAMLETVREYALERLEQSGEAAAIAAAARRPLPGAGGASGACAGRPRPAGRGSSDSRRSTTTCGPRSGGASPPTTSAAAALRLAGALGRFWEVRGHLTEGRRWLERALAVGAAAPPRRGRRRSARPGRWPTSKATTTRRRAHSSSRAWRSSVRRATRGASPRASIGSGAWPGSTATATWRGRSTSGAWRCVGTVATARAPPRRSATWAVSRPSGATARARAHPSKRVLELRRELGDRGGIATSLSHLGRLALDEGNRRRRGLSSRKPWQASASWATRAAPSWRCGGSRSWRRRRRTTPERRRSSRSAWPCCGTWGAPGRRRPTGAGLGRTALRRGDLRRATALVCESLAILRERRDERGLAWGLAALAGITAAAGRHARAARLLGTARRPGSTSPAHGTSPPTAPPTTARWPRPAPTSTTGPSRRRGPRGRP